MAVREGVEDLLRSAGLQVRSFRTAHEFMQYERPDVPVCLVLDVRLPDMEWRRSIASHVMQKMQVKSLIELVRMADKLGISAQVSKA